MGITMVHGYGAAKKYLVLYHSLKTKQEPHYRSKQK